MEHPCPLSMNAFGSSKRLALGAVTRTQSNELIQMNRDNLQYFLYILNVITFKIAGDQTGTLTYAG